MTSTSSNLKYNDKPYCLYYKMEFKNPMSTCRPTRTQPRRLVRPLLCKPIRPMLDLHSTRATLCQTSVLQASEAFPRGPPDHCSTGPLPCGPARALLCKPARPLPNQASTWRPARTHLPEVCLGDTDRQNWMLKE
jgi:hypothetical protein